MANLPLLNTPGAEWVEPGQTNPRGYLAVNPRTHPKGGLKIRDDTAGAGLAANLLGNPNVRAWPTGIPIIGMPLFVDDENNLWAPPYPTSVVEAVTIPGIRLGASSGVADEITPVTSTTTVSITNPTAYQMRVRRRIIVRDARLITPRKAVAYGLVIDGVGWPLFSGVPAYETSVIDTTGDVTVDAVVHTFVTSTSEINAIVEAEHVYSGSLDLPAVTIAPGATHSLAVQTAIFYQATTVAFDVNVGETTIELEGHSIADSSFGQEVA